MNFDPDRITFFAKTDARGQKVAFGIKAKDRQRHMYVIGKTGMGKSTLLENMAIQDIQNGEGIAFLDPHGSAAQTLLEYIPKERLDDVIYFAPFDMENPISFNVMEDVGHDKRHLVVSGLMSTFKKIWVDAWSARMEYILTNALLALLEYPDSTLISVNRMLSDKAYRKKVVENITDPAVRSYWVNEFASYTERFAAEALPAIQNKIGQFTGNPLIRNIIGQPKSSFDIRKIMDEKKILIMNLSKGLLGETNANLLGSMLTTRIYLAAMSRAELSVAEMKEMPNFYFYVDEFQSFANSTFANILSEARKYHLNLIIAHQYIEQMEEEVRDAVFGNVGTTIAFRVGPFDAEVLETIYTPTFLAPDLVNLGFAQIYLTLMIDGIGSRPFSAVTLPPIEQPDISYGDVAIATSRKKFTHSREEVEKIVLALHESERTKKKQKNTNESKGQQNGTKNDNDDNVPSEPHKSYSERQKETQQKEIKDKEEEKQSTQVEKKPRRTRKEPQKDFNEMKTALKNISDDYKKHNDDKKHNKKKISEKKKIEKDSRNRNELKNVLSGILESVKTQEEDIDVTKKENIPPETPETPETTKTPETPETSETTKTPETTEKPYVQPNLEKNETKNPMREPDNIVTNNVETKQKSTIELESKLPTGEIKELEMRPKKVTLNKITPKELERMMRITSNDKPPIK